MWVNWLDLICTFFFSKMLTSHKVIHSTVGYGFGRYTGQRAVLYGSRDSPTTYDDLQPNDDSATKWPVLLVMHVPSFISFQARQVVVAYARLRSEQGYPTSSEAADEEVKLVTSWARNINGAFIYIYIYISCSLEIIKLLQPIWWWLVLNQLRVAPNMMGEVATNRDAKVQKKKKVPSSSQNKHQQQERRYKDKLNKPSFRLVSDMFTKVWKKFEYLSCKPL